MNRKNYSILKIRANSLTFLLITVFLTATLFGTLLIKEASAIDYTEYTGTLDGGDYALRIPDTWNGMLVIYCRGYSPILPTATGSLAYFNATVNELVNQGFAIAGSTYGAAGFCIQAGVNSTYELTNYIVSTYNITGRVLLLGYSMGGAIALLLLEKYPDLYSGVLDVYGVKDLKEEYNVTMFASSIEAETGGTPTTQPEAYEDRSPTYHANITRPVITVHGTNDTAVPFYQATMYQTAVANAGHSNLYRLYSVADEGHLSLVIEAQVPSLFDELVEWSNYLTGVYDWPMFGYNPQRTGYTESPGPDTNQTLWTTNFGGMAGSHIAVADGKAYFSAWNSLFYCFDAATGVQIWNYTSGAMAASSPAVADGKVYVGSDDDNLYCLNATTGEKIWNYTTGGDVVSCPVVADGKVYVGSKDSNLYCLTADLGQVEWNYTTGAPIELSSPAVADGKVYIGSDDNNTYCLNATNGDLVWSYLTGDQIWSSPTVADGKIYVGSADDNVYCLNATTGEKIWNYTTGDDIGYSSPAVAYGRIYVGSYDANVYCLDAETGGLTWNYTTGGQVWGSPTVADGKVYVGSYDNNFYCLDATDGALVWSYTTGGIVLSSPVVAHGVAYALSADQTVYAFGTEYVIPETFGVEAVLLLSTVVAAVSLSLFRKRPKLKNSLLKNP